MGDVARLAFGLARELLCHPFDFNMESVLRRWARRTASRLESENLVINLFVKKLLLVGSPGLSHQILAEAPRRDRFSAGSLKRSAMAFLAAHALTISDDQEWVRRRAFNETVLEPERRHELAPQFVRFTLEAFASPVRGVADLRSAMGRAMLGVVFGGEAPPSLVQEIETLFGYVQSPVKRLLCAPYAYWKRARLYGALRRLWQEQNKSANPSLLQMAGRAAATLEDAELLQQVPHWMFTFTGSATDLVTRTLTLISAYPAAQVRAMAELESAGPLGEEAFEFAFLPFLEACLLEAGHLYPPVTQTFHRAVVGATAGEMQIPAGMEIMHLFPLFTASLPGEAEGPRIFKPERWMEGSLPACSFDPFLGGARRCPGRNLILLICKTALASLLVQHKLSVQAAEFGAGPLPGEFPSRGLVFQRA
jgi:cytochrome P450